MTNFIGTIKEVTHFIRGSAKRISAFKKNIGNIEDMNKRKLLTGLCETRWVGRTS